MGKPPSSNGRAGRRPAATRIRKKGPRLDGIESAKRYLLDRVDVERISPSRLAADTLKLDRMFELMELLDDPHRAVRMVHVAGTKGKGSTCEMVGSCLEACGYTVGLYTSPHLLDIRERIRINRRPVSEDAFVRAAQRVADAAANLDDSSGQPTFFELMTAMGFVQFVEDAVDVAVIEVGLGGRLDSTNVVVPEVSAITSISLDHMQILGDTVEKIAREKAGIFKRGVPAISAPQEPGVVDALSAVAASVEAPFHLCGRDIDVTVRFEATSNIGPHHRVSLSSPRNEFDHILSPLKGEHQAWNCALALSILDKLCERGFKTPAAKVTQGMARTRMPGRMELVSNSPRIVLDGAHNGASMACLMKALASLMPSESMVVIFGCAADKDITGMLDVVARSADKVIFTAVPGSARAADPKELARRLAESGKMSQVARDVGEALVLARKAVGREDLICVTGSLYLVAEAKKALSAPTTEAKQAISATGRGLSTG